MDHFNASKVIPCTSCFCHIQPSTTIGAQARVESVERFAQNNPFGLEKLATNTVNMPASPAVRLIAQKASFQHKTIKSSAVDAMALHASGMTIWVIYSASKYHPFGWPLRFAWEPPENN